MNKQIKKVITLTDIDMGKRVEGEIVIERKTLVGKYTERSLKKYGELNNLLFVEKTGERDVLASMSEEKFLNFADNIEEDQLSLEIE